MIVQIKGKLIVKKPPVIVIECPSGLAYELTVSMNTLYDLGEKQDVVLLTHFVVREDTQQLFGFAREDERELFQQLIKVNGIGPKSAITILSSISVNDFIFCVQQQDTARLVKLPGIGKKTAERLVIEMRDKLEETLTASMGIQNDTQAELAMNVTPRRSVVQDAISALIALGYKPAEASRAVSFIDDDTKDTQVLIRDALRSLSDNTGRGAA